MAQIFKAVPINILNAVTVMLDLTKNEEYVLDYWRRNGTNAKVREKNKGNKPFYFLDGPPFVSGDLHPAQIWTKAMKDAAIRYKRYMGFDVVDRAGYDVHGLPVENRLEKELGVQSKKEIEQKIGIERFTDECKAYVEKYIGRMDADYERFGISLDFKNPYLPYSKEYILTAWQLFKRMADRGFLYSGKRTLIYCPHCETPLSQGSMEVEYKDVDDPSIYVAFAIDGKASKPKVEIPEGTFLVIWTTTPWTLPSNVAIAVNPKYLYVLADAEGKKLILAKDRVDSFTAATGLSLSILGEFYGSQLEHVYYISPLEGKVPKQKELRKYHRIIFSESLVSMGEGTGLVHMAPGNGIDDYAVGMLNHLPIFSPVTPDARYSDDAGEYRGISVPAEANGVVISDLERSGALLKRESIRHSYPYCWRCSSKLIFLATDQWFMNVQRIKARMIKQNEKVTWHPAEVQSWQRSVLENSPDWCISRQRYWGIPMPIWICTKCGKRRIVGSMEELAENAVNGKEAAALENLHRPHIDKILLKCECGGESRRIPDILDVWFDSGITFRASITEAQFERLFPVDLILEYVEQIRAWFQYLMKCGMMGYGKIPFRHVMVHGIMAGTDGRKMSKSFGNFRPLSEITKMFTADAYRFWSIDHQPILNRNLNEQEIRDSGKMIIMLYNISNLYSEYSAAIGYRPQKVMKPRKSEGMDPEDAWILSRMNQTILEVTSGMEQYEFYKAAASARKFVIEDLSRFYLKMAKKSVLYSGRKKAKMTIEIINYLLYNTLILLSPLIPFATEKIYLETYGNPEEPQNAAVPQRPPSGRESIFLEEWPRANERLINPGLEADFLIAIDSITAVLNAREKAGIRLRQPLAGAVLTISSDSAISSLQRLIYLVEEYTNIRKVSLMQGSSAKKEARPVFARIGPAFKENAAAVAEAIKAGNAEEMLAAITSTGHYLLHTQKGTFEISAEHFTVLETASDDLSLHFKHGSVRINPEIDEKLREEALIRELERKIQLMRKEASLKKADTINVRYRASEQLHLLIQKNLVRIKKEIGAASMVLSDATGDDSKEYDIDGEKMLLSIAKHAAAKR